MRLAGRFDRQIDVSRLVIRVTWFMYLREKKAERVLFMKNVDLLYLIFSQIHLFRKQNCYASPALRNSHKLHSNNACFISDLR